MIPRAGRVGAEWTGRARLLRSKILLAQDAEARAIDAILKPLKPRPGWSSPDRPEWLEGLVGRLEALRHVGRLGLVADVRGSRIRIVELRLRAGRMTFPGWTQGSEPAVSIAMRAVTTAPFHDETTPAGARRRLQGRHRVGRPGVSDRGGIGRRLDRRRHRRQWRKGDGGADLRRRLTLPASISRCEQGRFASLTMCRKIGGNFVPWCQVSHPPSREQRGTRPRRESNPNSI
jgi:hypothetical protein